MKALVRVGPGIYVNPEAIAAVEMTPDDTPYMDGTPAPAIRLLGGRTVFATHYAVPHRTDLPPDQRPTYAQTVQLRGERFRALLDALAGVKWTPVTPTEQEPA